ncbi:hypothetical protein B0T18DRAFT_129193 [Schizothecium vesticola]|uniref:Uncharacterized protein n=1 Tax=Schizothecium vesticola TaxID=314040 RepID=A0AA40F3X6_9PEZI|nr:hypothetical protein B0T18DRAFT_129193 [Schizothecium vesticola]
MLGTFVRRVCAFDCLNALDIENEALQIRQQYGKPPKRGQTTKLPALAALPTQQQDPKPAAANSRDHSPAHPPNEWERTKIRPTGGETKVDRPAQLSCQTGAPRDLDAGPDPPRSGHGGDDGWRAGDLGPTDAEEEAIRNGPSRPLFLRRLGVSGERSVYLGGCQCRGGKGHVGVECGDVCDAITKWVCVVVPWRMVNWFRVGAARVGGRSGLAWKAARASVSAAADAPRSSSWR